MNNFVKLCIISFFLLFVHDSLGQTITWQRTYGGPQYDEGYSIVQTPDSGYIAIGRRQIWPFEYLNVFRLDKYGEVIWTKLFSKSGMDIEKTTDDNYIIMGGNNFFKININGDTLWSKGPFSDNKRFTSIKETSDGGFIICGNIELGFRNKPYMFKVSPTGDSLWEKIYTTNIFEGRFSDLVISNDNNYVMSANISDSSFVTDNLSIVKTDTLGNIVWYWRYDTLEYYSSQSICKSNDGGYIIGGEGGNGWLSKFNSAGNIEWLDFYDNMSSSCRSVVNTFDGNFVYAGWWDTNATGSFYARLRKVDNNGNEIWRKSFGFSGDEYSVKLRQTNDSGFIIMAFTDYGTGNEDLFIIKTDKNGNASPYIGIVPISNIIPVTFSFLPAYPNPFNPQTKLKFQIPQQSRVKLIIYDILGREVVMLVDEDLRTGEYSVTFNANNLPSGIYLAKLTAFSKNTEYSKTQKLVLLK